MNRRNSNLSTGRRVNVIRRWALGPPSATGDVRHLAIIKEDDQAKGLVGVVSMQACDLIYDTPVSFVTGDAEYSLYREMRVISVNCRFIPTNSMGERKGLTAMAILPSTYDEDWWSDAQFTPDFDNIARFAGASMGGGSSTRVCAFRPGSTDIQSFGWTPIKKQNEGKPLFWVALAWRSTMLAGSPTSADFSGELLINAVIHVRENAIKGIKLPAAVSEVWPDYRTHEVVKIGRIVALKSIANDDGLDLDQMALE